MSQARARRVCVVVRIFESTLYVTKFSDLGLSSTLLLTLEKEGYTTPTPIQAQAIPILLKGHDLLGIAQTGTGKTAAFALPIIQHIMTNRIMPSPKMVRTLILSPTRELASQIAESFKGYSKGLGLQIATIYGGVKYGPQYKALQGGLDILVATPGRLLDHLEQKTIDLRGVEFFVLDEADQMLDLGFVKPIRQIAQKLSHKRQNLFFSATMPKEIGALASELLTEPKRVEITPEATTAERVSQQVIFVEAQRKRALMTELYVDDKLERTLVFTRTKRSADRVAAYLQAGGIEAAAIHGDKNQSQRERALQAFRAGKVRALVATDIAARGIDVDGVTHVINFELPNVPEAYVHRIGRTARAGRSGISITLVADDERRLLKDIERTTRQHIPSFDRRKDNALKLLDEAMTASGKNIEKPATPDRLPEHRKKGDPKPGKGWRNAATADGEPRHFDPEAENVHKRSRNRTGSGGPGKKRFGDKPFGERSFGGDRPFADRPAGDRPFAGDRPQGERPQGDRPLGDRPYNSRPQGERSSGNRPYNDRGDRKPYNAEARTEQRYDPTAADRGPAAAKPYKPRNDRRDDQPRAPREFAPRDQAPRSGDRREDSRPGARKGFGGNGGKPSFFKGPKTVKGNAGPQGGGFKGERPANGEINRSEGAQLKRRTRS